MGRTSPTARCFMNKFEQMKAAKDGLDVLPDLLRYAAERTPIEEIPPDDLDRMKWYGVFHRKVTPGYFMMRLRIPGGILTSTQVRAIANIARDYGRGTADLTTRENIQLRWLTLPTIPAIFEQLARVGITTRQSGMDNARNITGCREDCAHAQTQDLGFLPATRATPGGRQTGFNVLVGGALGGTSPRLATPLDVFVTPEQVVPFFLALLTVYRDHGPREQRTKARLKWLIAEWGEEHLRAAVERELGYSLARAGRTETRRTAGDHLGVHPQREPGLLYVGLHVPVGRIQATQLSALADLADRYGNGELRLTVDQNVIVPGVPAARVRDLLREPLLQELRPDPPSVWRNLVACTGNDYCHFSLIDTKGCAIALARALEERGVDVPEGTRIHVSGCVHACGKHHVGAIGIEGANVRIGDEIVEAANVFVGGALGRSPRLAELVSEKVTLDALPDLAAMLLVERCGATIDASEAVA